MSIQRVLIANRGEIAVRIIRACHEMGVETVIVYSTADADSLGVKLADQAVCIGPPSPVESYLKANMILSAAVATKCDAVHPGFGFLSENAEFAAMCEAIGIKFIGPNSQIISQLGQKAVAKQIMKSHGVPVIPGPEGTFIDPEVALAEARKIGFPVIIKAASGGGGRGIRVIEDPTTFVNSFLEASTEAQNAFNDPQMYVEKFFAHPKHIEFQMLADQHGNCVCLGERDCSAQRRKQKVVEETPSPVLGDALRSSISAKLCSALTQIGYWNAGTVEFLYEKGELFFMEMNTRIQVEHPVTEMVTSTDLIQEQIRIASNEPLNFTQAQIQTQGCAIEVRLNAEDPAHNFRPSPGTLTTLHFPGGNGLRIDSAMFTGAKIPPYYDSMVAKIIAHAPDRPQAIAKIIRALQELQVEGIVTNREFLLQVLTSDDFIRGDYDINFVETKLLKAEVK